MLSFVGQEFSCSRRRTGRSSVVKNIIYTSSAGHESSGTDILQRAAQQPKVVIFLVARYRDGCLLGYFTYC
jgi:hypothetical protein